MLYAIYPTRTRTPKCAHPLSGELSLRLSPSLSGSVRPSPAEWLRIFRQRQQKPGCANSRRFSRASEGKTERNGKPKTEAPLPAGKHFPFSQSCNQLCIGHSRARVERFLALYADSNADEQCVWKSV